MAKGYNVIKINNNKVQTNDRFDDKPLVLYMCTLCSTLNDCILTAVV